MGDSEILEGLNPQQREAVLTTEGPLLVLAGAGSGKTSVLTRRIAYILQQGLASGNNLLAVTFTNKAAKEMVERIECLCGAGGFPYVGTFHSVCAKWLRREAELLGISDRFSIYDAVSQLSVMKATLQELKLEDKQYPPRAMLARVSRCKNYDENVAAMEASANPYEQTVARVYNLYNKKLHANDALDFDDILTYTVTLLRDHEEAREKYCNICRYVLVDEYQDVNPVQYELLRILSSKHKNICAVGDDDQSIYGFRGADISIILSFEKDFPESKVIKLEQNYRSTQGILDVANALVRRNSSRMGKNLWSDKNDGTKPQIFVANDGREEALFVVRKVRELCSHGYSPADITVLYRTNAQSRTFEEVFLQRGISYDIVGGNKFYERKEIKDVLAHLCLLVNKADTISVGRVMSILPGVGETSLKKVVAYATVHQIDLFEALALALEAGCQPHIAEKMRHLHDWLSDMSVEAINERLPVLQIVRGVLARTAYKERLQKLNTDEARSRVENLEELINVVAEFDRKQAAIDDVSPLESFLSEISLLSDQDSYEEEQQRVTLMTIHTSKGLEFPVVFLVGVDEGSLPHFRSLEAGSDASGVEEERRLCYVGMTRARQRLFLTTAARRYVNGSVIPKEPSRFLAEVPKKFYDLRCCRAREADSIFGRSESKPVRAYSDAPAFGKPWMFADMLNARARASESGGHGRAGERGRGFADEPRWKGPTAEEASWGGIPDYMASAQGEEPWCDDSQGDFYDECASPDEGAAYDEGAAPGRGDDHNAASDQGDPWRGDDEPRPPKASPAEARAAAERYARRIAPRKDSGKATGQKVGAAGTSVAGQPGKPTAGKPILTPRQIAWAAIAERFPIGVEVEHSVFGPGVVRKVERDTITVLFAGGKQRALKESYLTLAGAAGEAEAAKLAASEAEGLFSERNTLQPGDVIEHVQFGRGVIVSLSGEDALIAFSGMHLQVKRDTIKRCDP